MKGELPANFAPGGGRRDRGRAYQGRDGGQPQGQPDRARGLHPGAARDARRLGRPDRLQPDQHRIDAGAALRRRRRRRQRRPPHQLRRARVRHGRDHERHRAARRLHPLRRHLPDLQRLQPQRHPHGRADEAARDPCLHARLHRPGRGRPHAPERRACGQPAPDPQPRRLAPGRHRRDRGGLDRGARQPARGPTALLLSRQNLPYAPKAGTRRHQQGRLRAGRAGRGGPEEEAAGGDHRHRHRGAAGAARAGRSWRSRRSRCAWSRMPSTTVFDRQSAAYKTQRAAAPACRASRSRRA